MQPPTDMSPVDLFVEITRGEFPYRIVDFPRKFPEGHPNAGKPVGELALRILSHQDQMAAAASAERVAGKLIKERPKSDEAKRGYEDVYTNQAAVEILFRAARRKEDVNMPLFPSVDAISKHLTPDEVGVLFAQYLQIQSELGPIIANMSDEDADMWIDVLSKGGSALPLAFLTSDARDRLTLILVSRLRESQTGSGSPGSQPEDGSPTSKSDTEVPSEPQ